MFQVRPNRCQAEQENPIPSSTSDSLTNSAQDAVGLHCCQGTWLAHLQFALCQDTLHPFNRTTSQTASNQLVLLLGTIPSQVQDLTFMFAESHVKSYSCWPNLNSLLRSVYMVTFPFSTSTSSPSLCSFSYLVRVHSVLPSRSFMKLNCIDSKRTSFMTRCQHDFELLTTTL